METQAQQRAAAAEHHFPNEFQFFHFAPELPPQRPRRQ